MKRIGICLLCFGTFVLFASISNVWAQEHPEDDGGGRDPHYTVLHNFQGNTNAQGNFDPLLVRGLVVDERGTIYGESAFGGSQTCFTISNFTQCFDNGAEFKLDRAGHFTLFANPTSPGGPLNGSLGPMLLDHTGNVTFASIVGGDLGVGGVFSLDPHSGDFTTLFSFSGRPIDGAFSSVNVIRDSAGNLYGTTLVGGQNSDPVCQLLLPGCGTVYKVDGQTHQETVLHTFSFTDGFQPVGLALDNAGNLFGAVSLGDNFDCRDPSNPVNILGCGAIFRIDRSGDFRFVHEFDHTSTCPFVFCQPPAITPTSPELLGWAPQFVVVDEDDNIFGVTGGGGNFGLGVIFKIDPAGHYSVLHHFAGPGDGFNTQQVLLRDHQLYGINQEGGNTLDCDFGNNGCGTIFRLDTGTGKYQVLHTFSKNDEGTTPTALSFDQNGDLIGSNLFGGNGSFDPTICTGGGGCGNVFRLKLSERGENDK